jgi:formate hydrogenlyase transcriptional activator
MAESQPDAGGSPVGQSQFETLLVELSSRLINLPADKVDQEIEDAQRRICEHLGLDRSTLWRQPPEQPDELAMTHAYQRPGSPALPSPADGRTLLPWFFGRLLRGETVIMSTPGDLPPEAARDKETLCRVGTKSTLAVPLSIGGMGFGALTFACVREHRDWPETFVRQARLIAECFANAIARARSEKALRQAYEEVKQLRDQLEQQNVYLKQEVKLLHGHDRLVGQSQAIRRVLMQAEQVAPTGSTVLLLGETGTGKELIASAIHDLSPRRDRVMVRVNCSAIPATLIESELFGREKGAYTGALSKQIGRFEMAQGSTLFLDEIGDLPLEMQVKLLRVLQDKRIERLGSSKPIDVDVRIIAATNHDLENAVRNGKFRQDLYYRLNVFPITVPPLRERREDIPPLVSAFVAEFAAALGKNIESIDRDSMEALKQYDWPGNVRELRNVIERAMIVITGPKLRIDLGGAAASASALSLSVRENEERLIRKVLGMTGWRIRGRNGAAEILGLKPTTLESRMAKLGIRRPAQDSTK